MATGSGKTVVMAMLVALQVLNKRRYPHDNRFTDAFLVVAPGITIRDRLRVLLPSDPNNYYRELDIVPTEYRGDLGTVKIVVTNFHAFKQREKGDAGGLTKRVLTANTPGAFTESPDEMVNRVCNDLGKHREIMVINDEAHHCYRGKPAETKERMTREEASEAKARDEEARLWITGLEAVHRKIGVKSVFDLSATPFYLKGSGTHPAWGVVALPLLARLYVRRKDLDGIAPAHRPPFQTKLEMAVGLMRWAVTWLGFLGKPLWVVADGAYAKAPFLEPMRSLGVTVVSRLRKDSNLRTVPVAR